MAGVGAMTTSQKPATAEELLAMIEEYERLIHSTQHYDLADYQRIVFACKAFLKAMEDPE